jgi:hypothetical protein
MFMFLGHRPRTDKRLYTEYEQNPSKHSTVRKLYIRTSIYRDTRRFNCRFSVIRACENLRIHHNLEIDFSLLFLLKKVGLCDFHAVCEPESPYLLTFECLNKF